MRLRIHRFLPYTRVEGPGERACIWVQGCPIRCSGCAVPWTWPEHGGQEIDVAELAHKILTGPPIEGVTFVGGEPFAQAEALAELGRTVKAAGLSVVTFTGYVLEKILRSPRPGWHDLLAVTDLLIDGPFKRDLLDTSRPWVGSSNQRYHFLTERYRHLKDHLEQIPNRIEVRIGPDGSVLINGLAPSDDIWYLAGNMLQKAESSTTLGGSCSSTNDDLTNRDEQRS
ncbi:MAG: ribonucleoside-triphosphate reductase activating protein [Candidatus Dadabacteria bacterium]